MDQNRNNQAKKQHHIQDGHGAGGQKIFIKTQPSPRVYLTQKSQAPFGRRRPWAI